MSETIHIHKLKKLRYKSGNSIFFCCQPDCKFKTAVPLALGKRSICWRCGSEFLMSDYSLRLMKPHCESCHKTQKNGKVEQIITIDGTQHDMTPPIEYTLADRLQQTINQKQSEEEDI